MQPTTAEPDPAQYVTRLHDDPGAVDAAAWDALLAAQAEPLPFMRHAYLLALHASGSAVAETGWAPQFLTLELNGTLVAACPLYAKGHSYGEYVFDWAWADAYRRHGLRYYPKWLLALPFTPVPGTRLMARDDTARAALVQALTALAQQSKFSSAHALFLAEADVAAFEAAGWMLRRGVQFHWQQDAQAPAADFTALLATMTRDKRKKIQQERRRVAEAGVVFRVVEGAAIAESDWRFFHRCYERTYAEHHSTPYLTLEFFLAMARTMPEHWLMFVAERDGRAIATSLVAIDRARGTAWGRYWGALDDVPCLHFEACYYQPLAWCLAHGFERFEGGAQGEHKMARGLLPVGTVSAHWLRDARFADAVGEFLGSESGQMERYVQALGEHTPFKARPPA
jgi:predicted N-acyltransferase